RLDKALACQMAGLEICGLSAASDRGKFLREQKPAGDFRILLGGPHHVGKFGFRLVVGMDTRHPLQKLAEISRSAAARRDRQDEPNYIEAPIERERPTFSPAVSSVLLGAFCARRYDVGVCMQIIDR